MDDTIRIRSSTPGSDAEKDGVIDINLERRELQMPLGDQLGVWKDCGLKKKFRVVRYYDDLDLSTFTIYINIMNAAGDGNMYTAEDLVIGDDDITFSLTIDGFMTAAPGTMLISVSFVKTVDDAIQTKISTSYSGQKVRKGLSFDAVAIEKDPDIVAALLSIKSGRYYIQDGCLMWSRMLDEEVIENLGVVTAYGYALEGGYSGTEEEFQEYLASIEENAEIARTYGTQAIQSAEAASTYQQQAAGSASSALESRNAAQTCAQAAQVSAQSAAESYGGAEAAKSAAVSAKNAAQAAQQAVEENLNETRNWRFYLDDGDLMFERTVY